MDENEQLAELLKARFAQLPKVVQDAITSADVTKHMRELANQHKLHLDQWEALESVVQLTLLAIKPVEDLAPNIKSEVGVSDEVAKALAQSVSQIVFEPVRQELERGLAHPEAKEKEMSGAEAARSSALAQEKASATPAPEGAIATPAPTQATVTKDVSYHSNTPSHERGTIEGDPYREQVA